jgi:hypothetical protein
LLSVVSSVTGSIFLPFTDTGVPFSKPMMTTSDSFGALDG